MKKCDFNYIAECHNETASGETESYLIYWDEKEFDAATNRGALRFMRELGGKEEKKTKYKSVNKIKFPYVEMRSTSPDGKEVRIKKIYVFYPIAAHAPKVAAFLAGLENSSEKYNISFSVADLLKKELKGKKE